jgi:hypothetical protein
MTGKTVKTLTVKDAEVNGTGLMLSAVVAYWNLPGGTEETH